MITENDIKVGRIAVSSRKMWDKDLQRDMPVKGEITQVNRLERTAIIEGNILRFEEIKEILF